MQTTAPAKPVKPCKDQSIRKVTDNGTWRTIDFGDGRKFREFKSHAEIMGRPLVCIASGRDPITGKMAVAKGIIAIGQRASGTIAIGQFVNGTVSIGQFATGRVLAIGQFAIAPLSLGQIGIGLAFAAQVGFGGWGAFQLGAVTFGGVGQIIVNVLTLLGM